MGEYVFNQDTDPYIIRHMDEWFHPYLKGVPMYQANKAIRDLLDQSVPLEDRLELQKKYMEGQAASFPKPPQELLDQVTMEEVHYPGLEEGDPELSAWVITPKSIADKKRNPCMLYFFAGGLVMGSKDTELNTIVRLVLATDCVAFVPDYRLLPEYIYPSQVNDAEAAVNYLLDNARDLRVDPKKIVALGMSAGGGVAAMLSMRLKMRGGYQLCGQVLYHPGPWSDKLNYPSSRLYVADIWQPMDEQLMYEVFMGPNYNRSALPWDAAPGDCLDFKGLPPTFISTGDLDFDRDPHIRYAQGLMDAGIFCDLRVWGGCFHTGAGFGIGTPLYDRRFTMYVEALTDLFTGECGR